MKLRRTAAIVLVVLFTTLVAAVSVHSHTLNLLAAMSGGDLTPDQAYGPLSRRRPDIFSPGSGASRPPRGYPLVVFFYGGACNRGDRADYRFVGQALASRGMVVLLADDRLYPEVRYPDSLGDCALAMAYALDQAGQLNADPGLVFVMGHSAGGVQRGDAGTGWAPAGRAGASS
jgi:acetyl esterase/lipase